MDGERFDALTRCFNAGHPRRAVLRAIAALFLTRSGDVAWPQDASAAQNGDVPDAFVGDWAGGGVQSNPSLDWPITMSLWSGSVGEVVGSVSYPSFGCQGELTLISADDGASVEVAERITTGIGTCVDGGAFVLTSNDADSLSFNWMSPNSSSRAMGTLLSSSDKWFEVEPVGRLRLMIMACEATTTAEWIVTTMDGAVDPGPGCTGLTEPRPLSIRGPFLEGHFPETKGAEFDTTGMSLNLPLGEFLITDLKSTSNTSFEMTSTDRRAKCDGLSACGTAVLVLPSATVHEDWYEASFGGITLRVPNFFNFIEVSPPFILDDYHEPDFQTPQPQAIANIWENGCQQGVWPMCYPIELALYPAEGLDLQAWLAQYRQLTALSGTEQTIQVEGVDALTYAVPPPPSFDSGQHLYFIVPTGDQMLVVHGPSEGPVADIAQTIVLPGSPKPNAMAPVTYELTVVGTPPPEATFFARTDPTTWPSGGPPPMAGTLIVQLLDDDGDGVYTGIQEHFAIHEYHISIVQGTGVQDSAIGLLPGQPVKVLQDFGTMRITAPRTITAGVSFAPQNQPDSPPDTPEGLMPGTNTVVIFAPGIDPDLSQASNDPYALVRETFKSIIDKLACVTSPVGPPLCDGGLTFVPYSYAGVDPATGPRPYTGEDTGQPFLLSRNAMQDTVAYARSLAPNARIVLVGHSLGGAVAAFYGADDPAVEVVTLDSPVNGIWTDDSEILATYCSDSAGLLGFRTGVACPFGIAKPGLGSEAAEDLRRPQIQERMGRANAMNFANAVDLAVPSWFASNPASPHGSVILAKTCVLPDKGAVIDFLEFPQHICIVDAAADAVAEIVRDDSWPRPSPRMATIPLTVRFLSAGDQVNRPARAAVRIVWDGPDEALTATFEIPLGAAGQTTLEMPWRDVLVELTLFGALDEPLGTFCRAALPGENQAMEVSFLYPNMTPGACPQYPKRTIADGREISSYTITDLGTLPNMAGIIPLDMNASGAVVGYTYLAGMPGDAAFLWRDGAISDLGTLPGEADAHANAINDYGQIVGNSGSFEGAVHAFLWDQGQMTELPVIPDSMAVTPRAINEIGQIVGHVSFASPYISEPTSGPYAFLYDNGAVTNLGALGGADAEAFDINNLGQIVGSADTAEGIQHAFLYHDGAMIDLGMLPDHEASRAAAINDQGLIVGFSIPNRQVFGARAFLYRDGEMVDVGVLPGHSSSEAKDINSLGQVVGASSAPPLESRAFLYDAERRVLVDLNGLIPGDSGWLLTQASAINDAGQIVGSGMLDGQSRAVLLTPADSAQSPQSHQAPQARDEPTGHVSILSLECPEVTEPSISVYVYVAGAAAPTPGMNCIFSDNYFYTITASDGSQTPTGGELPLNLTLPLGEYTIRENSTGVSNTFPLTPEGCRITFWTASAVAPEPGDSDQTDTGSTSEDHTFVAEDWRGGLYQGNGDWYGRPWVAIYGAQSEYPAAALYFSLKTAMGPDARLVVTGLDDEFAANTAIEVAANGVIVFSGASPFLNWDGNMTNQGIDAAWTEAAFVIPADILTPGENVVTIANLEPTATVGAPPWVLLGDAALTLR